MRGLRGTQALGPPLGPPLGSGKQHVSQDRNVTGVRGGLGRDCVAPTQ